MHKGSLYLYFEEFLSSHLAKVFLVSLEVLLIYPFV